jgi:hypothetical protein
MKRKKWSERSDRVRKKAQKKAKAKVGGDLESSMNA